MNKCEYGCGNEAKHLLKNSKLCCEKIWQRCPGIRKKIEDTKKGKERKSINYQEHKKWKLDVLHINGNKCQLCDEVNNLAVLHIYSIDDFPHLAIIPEYGITLCPKHTHTLKNKVE